MAMLRTLISEGGYLLLKDLWVNAHHNNINKCFHLSVNNIFHNKQNMTELHLIFSDIRSLCVRCNFKRRVY